MRANLIKLFMSSSMTHWTNKLDYIGFASSGLYYKHITIVNDDSRIVNKCEASLTDDAIVIMYDHHMFIVQATGNPY
jgi:hypothetical protein